MAEQSLAIGGVGIRGELAKKYESEGDGKIEISGSYAGADEKLQMGKQIEMSHKTFQLFAEKPRAMFGLELKRFNIEPFKNPFEAAAKEREESLAKLSKLYNGHLGPLFVAPFTFLFGAE